MKKLISVLLVLALFAGLTACAGSKSAAETTTAAAETTAAATSAAETSAAETSAAAGTTAASALENRTYTVVCSADFPPYEYFENDKIVGAEVDIMDAVAKQLGITVSYEDMDFDAIIPAIESGKFDIGMSGFTITDERKQMVNFTDSYTTACQAVIVPNGSPITSADDLKNNIGKYKIGVQLSTTGDIYATDDFGADNVEEYTKATDAVLALTSGKIDCVIIDDAVAKAYVAANTGLSVLKTAYVTEDYAMILNKKSTDLLSAMNGAIQGLLADGTVDKIMGQYIK